MRPGSKSPRAEFVRSKIEIRRSFTRRFARSLPSERLASAKVNTDVPRICRGGFEESAGHLRRSDFHSAA